MRNLKPYIGMQMLNVLFSFSGVLMKFAAMTWEEKGLFNIELYSYIAAYLLLMAMYALFWQRIIKRVALSSAYLCKGMALFWSLLWSALIFRERISIYNMLGIGVIFVGTFMMAVGDE